MIMKKLAAMALVLPLTLVSLTGFAGDETEEKKDDSNKSEMMIQLQNLLAEDDQNDETTDEVPVEENKRIETLSENDADEVVVEDDSENKGS